MSVAAATTEEREVLPSVADQGRTTNDKTVGAGCSNGTTVPDRSRYVSRGVPGGLAPCTIKECSLQSTSWRRGGAGRSGSRCWRART